MELALTIPLIKREWMRIKELLGKDELDLEEALELKELARKVIEEHGDKYEAWKLHIYADIAVGRAAKKQGPR